MKRILIIIFLLLIQSNVYSHSESSEWKHFFSSNTIHTLYSDGDYIWSYGYANALLQFNPDTKTFQHFHEGNGTSGNWPWTASGSRGRERRTKASTCGRMR